MNLYRDSFDKHRDFLQFRPFLIHGKAYIIPTINGIRMPEQEIPIECARFTLEQWKDMDYASATTIAEGYPLLKKLRSLHYERRKAEARCRIENVVFIHKDFNATILASECSAYVAERVEEIIVKAQEIDKDCVHLVQDIVIIQKNPVHNDESTWTQETRLSAICALWISDDTALAQLGFQKGTQDESNIA